MNALQQSQLSLFPDMPLPAMPQCRNVINVASVPQRSPFRYPGGKTWLVPTARKWFRGASKKSELIEPFAGGGIISLTAVAENFFNHATMVEIDDDMAAAWQTIFSDDNCDWLVHKVKTFVVTAEDINQSIIYADNGTKERGFATIVRNRTNHGGILAKGSGLIKSGEGGRGLASRWYPSTLAKRIKEANLLREKITFVHGDAFKIMEQHLADSNTFFFIDPPYTVAGKRLYNHFDVDHHRIFELASQMEGHFLLTYDDTEEVRALADSFSLPYRTIPMQTTHLITKEELLISDNFEWLD
ncbi:MAG: DNA adenine methylase [Bacteroidales bacterium]|nr:DNA adenine methylase [Bacteroidales bacterium]